MVTTNDEELYKLGCLLRSHGDDSRYHHILVGLNYRMTDIAAVIGLNQIAEMEHFLEKRRNVGKKYKEGVSKIEGLIPQKVENKVKHSYSYFSMILDPDRIKCDRDEFIKSLRAEHIDCAVHYPIPLNKQPAILDILNPEACPVSEEISERIFSIPMHTSLTSSDIRNVLEGLEKVVAYYQKQ
jgi:perosamine synthetase